MTEFILNDTHVSTEALPGEVALDLIRGEFGLVGTKTGCREGDCGACTVLLGTLREEDLTYRAVASCLLPIGELHRTHVVTIEGLNGDDLTPVQQAMVDEGATQCGFCTPGFVMSLTGFLLTSPGLTLDDALAAIEGNICRCTGYASIVRAVELMLERLDASVARSTDRVPDSRVAELVAVGALPAFFLEAADLVRRVPPLAARENGEIVVGGGTDLYVQRLERMREARITLLSRRPKLAGVLGDGDTIRIGAATTVEDLRHDATMNDIVPGWNDTLQLISSGLVRNRATVGGNLVNASPIADLAIVLLALGATLVLEKDGTVRRVALSSFYRGYKELDLAAGELVTTVEIPRPAADARFNFEKVSRRGHLDIAGVNSAALVEGEAGTVRRATLAAGGVACVPLALVRASEHIEGRVVTPELVGEVAEIAVGEAAPITDVRGSADYRRHLLRRLVIAHFAVLFPSLNMEPLLS